MTARLKDKRLAALELERQRTDQQEARRLRQRQGEAARTFAAFARALVLEAVRGQDQADHRAAAPVPSIRVSSRFTEEERKEAELDRLRALLQGYQLNSLEAMKLVAKHPELAIVKGWKEPPPPPRRPSWCGPDPFHHPPHPDDPMPGGGFIRPSYYISPKD